MLLCVVLMIAISHSVHGLPNLESFKIPKVDVLSPAELNNLGSEHQKRSIKVGSQTLNNVEATVKEVQDMIKANPTLPRLTRGEILDILENITKSDVQKAKLQTLTGQRDPKAIMVVMPYTPQNPNDDKNMEDLYTKPPVTHIIGGEPFTKQQNNIQNKHKSRRRPAVSTKHTSNAENETNKHFEPTKSDFRKIPTQTSTTSSTRFPELRSATTKKPAITTELPSSILTTRTIVRRVRTTTVAPQKVTEDTVVVTTRRSNRRRPPVTTERSETLATTYHPRGRRPLRRRPSTSTSTVTTTRYPNHRYPDDSQEIHTEISKENYLPSNGIVVVNPPQLILPSDINKDFYDLAMQENRRAETYTPKDRITPEFPTQNFAPLQKTNTPVTEISVKDTKVPAAEKLTAKPTLSVPKFISSTQPALSEEINIPVHLDTVVKDMKLDPSLIDIPENYHKQYEVTTHSPSKEDKERIQSLLESLGVGPSRTTLLPTTTAVPDVSNIADTLSPEMRDLLMSFGLIPNPNGEAEKPESIPYNPEKAEVDPASYVGFKPLPEDNNSRDEMESLLASFGLGRSSRKQKSLDHVRREDRFNELNFDAVPDAYKDVIRDIGLDEHSRTINIQSSKNKLEMSQMKDDDDNNKRNEGYASPEELEKLEKLMSIIKQLESLNRNVTEDDLKTIDMDSLQELVGSLNDNSNSDNESEIVVPLDERPAPNPLNYDNSISKNEVKRQELSLSGNVSIVTPSVVSSTTEEPRIPSLVDLEGSFGGQAASADQVASTTSTTEAPTTTAKRTGFYYLVDWNSFLDIDDQKGKRVNLRLQPTIGDPKRFLSVSVP